jgi:hypothetical protein
LAFRVAWEETTDVNLVGDGADTVEVMIRGVQVPFLAEVMINASHAKVALVGQGKGPFIATVVKTVAVGAIVRQR